MLIDLKLMGKTTLIIGGGEVGERKARKFLGADSKVIVASRVFTDGLKQLAERGKIKLIKANFKAESSSFDSLVLNSDVVIAATDDQKLNENIGIEARKRGILTSVVDNPPTSDFYLPATTRFGEIRIAISTGGRSPAMARVLRKKLEEVITREEVLQVELQHYVRGLAKSHISNKEDRRDFLYQIIHDSHIKQLLQEGDLEEAKTLAKQMLKHS